MSNPVVRQANSRDIAGMHRVRLAVRENRLASPISEVDYVPQIEPPGRGWVVEVNGAVAGFAVANARTGNLWALFVDPRFERQGIGRALHDAMLPWFFSQGIERAWLTTQGGTRAERFYRSAGWRHASTLPTGELLMELSKPGAHSPQR